MHARGDPGVPCDALRLRWMPSASARCCWSARPPPPKWVSKPKCLGCNPSAHEGPGRRAGRLPAFHCRGDPRVGRRRGVAVPGGTNGHPWRMAPDNCGTVEGGAAGPGRVSAGDRQVRVTGTLGGRQCAEVVGQMPCPVWLSIGVERQAVGEELGEIGGALTKASGEPHHRTQRGGWYHDGSGLLPSASKAICAICR